MSAALCVSSRHASSCALALQNGQSGASGQPGARLSGPLRRGRLCSRRGRLLPAPSNRTTAHRTAAGTAIGIYWLVDAYVIGIPTVVLAAWLNALIVFAVVAVVVTSINIWAGGWINREWDNWAGGKVEAKLQKVRSKGVGKKVSGWVDRGSDAWFMLAAALTCAITTVGLARITAGKPLRRHRILLAALGYGIFFAGLFSLIGWLGGDAIRAL